MAPVTWKNVTPVDTSGALKAFMSAGEQIGSAGKNMEEALSGYADDRVGMNEAAMAAELAQAGNNQAAYESILGKYAGMGFAPGAEAVQQAQSELRATAAANRAASKHAHSYNPLTKQLKALQDQKKLSTLSSDLEWDAGVKTFRQQIGQATPEQIPALMESINTLGQKLGKDPSVTQAVMQPYANLRLDQDSSFHEEAAGLSAKLKGLAEAGNLNKASINQAYRDAKQIARIKYKGQPLLQEMYVSRLAQQGGLDTLKQVQSQQQAADEYDFEGMRQSARALRDYGNTTALIDNVIKISGIPEEEAKDHPIFGDRTLVNKFRTDLAQISRKLNLPPALKYDLTKRAVNDVYFDTTLRNELALLSDEDLDISKDGALKVFGTLFGAPEGAEKAVFDRVLKRYQKGEKWYKSNPPAK